MFHFRSGLRVTHLGKACLVSVSTLTLISCGASSNSAPVVYGTEPAQGRVYNSPAEIYLEQPGQVGVTQTAPAYPVQSRPAQPGDGRIYDRRTYTAANTQQPVAQGVQIYNSPPVPVQAPIQQVAIQSEPLQQNVYNGSYNSAPIGPVNGEPVNLAPYGQASTPQQPAYRGLPPTPEYRSQVASAPAPLYSGQSQYIQPAASAQGGGGSIVVQPGDTIYAISQRTGYSQQDLINFNGLISPYSLAVGQRLLLPTSSTVSTYATSAPSYTSPAPVYSSPQPVAAPINSGPIGGANVGARDVLYTVNAGDTLYSIARRNNLSVQSIANANRIGAPYSLTIGQRLLLPSVPNGAVHSNAGNFQPAPSPRAATTQTSNIETLTRNASFNTPGTRSPTQFQWPVKGSVIANYGTGGIGRRNDGINISAPQGTPVRAAAAGEVVYRGSELDGYGNLLLIKHDGGFVTAYAHNDVMLVRKGQKVKADQIIAKVGKTGAVNEPQLHFEIRQNLKSINPVPLLAAN